MKLPFKILFLFKIPLRSFCRQLLNCINFRTELLAKKKRQHARGDIRMFLITAANMIDSCSGRGSFIVRWQQTVIGTAAMPHERHNLESSAVTLNVNHYCKRHITVSSAGCLCAHCQYRFSRYETERHRWPYCSQQGLHAVNVNMYENHPTTCVGKTLQPMRR